MVVGTFIAAYLEKKDFIQAFLYTIGVVVATVVLVGVVVVVGLLLGLGATIGTLLGLIAGLSSRFGVAKLMNLKTVRVTTLGYVLDIIFYALLFALIGTATIWTPAVQSITGVI